jgi:hypothetical protein
MHGRRRRRHAAAWSTAAVTALILGTVAMTMGFLRMREDLRGPSAVSPAADVPAAPKPDQVTVDLDPTSGYVATVRGTDAGRQFVTAKDFRLGGPAGGRYAGEVTAYEAGAFDPAALLAGEILSVHGHDARFVPDYRFATRSDGDRRPLTTGVLGWQDPSGVWVLVYADAGQAVDRQEIQRLAASVTIAPPRDLRTPFRLGGTLPDGLATTYVRADEDRASRRSGTVGLSAPDRRPSIGAVYTGSPAGVRVSVFAAAPDGDWARERATLTGHTTVDGHPAWYVTGTNPLSRPDAGARLVVETPHCVLSLLTADRRITGRDDLAGIVRGLAIGDCGDPDTWITPLS